MYKVLYSEKAYKKLKKFDKSVQRMIVSYVNGLKEMEEPRAKGKALSGNLKGFWRYRVLDYRIICEIDDSKITIVVVDIGHRSNIYN